MISIKQCSVSKQEKVKDYPLVGTQFDAAFGHRNVTNGVNERKHVKILWKFSKYIRMCPIIVVEKHATNSKACILSQGPLKMWMEHFTLFHFMKLSLREDPRDIL